MSCVKRICIHFIDEKTDKVLWKEFSNYAPRIGETVRFGGFGNEKYFKIIEVVWCYDEEGPYERLNVGVSRIEEEK
jgi:hypothetical protein